MCQQFGIRSDHDILERQKKGLGYDIEHVEC